MHSEMFRPDVVPVTEPIALGQEQAAEALGLSTRTVRALVARGELPCIRVGRRVLFRRATLDQWLRDRERLGDAP